MNLNKKTLWLDIVPTVAAAVLIIIFAVWREQSFIKTLPTLITLVVQLLLVRANRIAFLLGGVNSALYAVGFIDEALYFSATSALLISVPVQIFTFFNWRRKAEKGSTVIKGFSWRARIGLASAVALGWIVCYKLVGELISCGRFVGADSFVFVIGIAVPFLSAFGYTDAQYINIAACLTSLVMWLLITIESPQNINFVIISAYNLFRVTEAAVNWTVIARKNCAQKSVDDRFKLTIIRKAKRRTQ